METLIHVVKIYSQDKGMEFGIEKCAMHDQRNGTTKPGKKLGR